MAFNFPNTPVENDVYNPVGGPSYIYKSPVWRVNSSAAPILKDARRNRIVNGAMQISQENGNTQGGANAYYWADQWCGFNSTSGVVNGQRVQVVTPNKSVNRLRFTVALADAAIAAGDVYQIYQSIEGVRVSDFGWGAAGARQVILRFGFKGPAGTYAASIQNGAETRSYIAVFTISAGQANTDIEQTLIIPGDVTGVWATDTSRGIKLTFCLATGTSYQGVAGWQAGNLFSTAAQTNGLSSTSNVFELFDVGLYLDADNSGVAPKWEMPDEAQELAACKRYWHKLNIYVPTISQYLNVYYKASMRVAPAVASDGAGLAIAQNSTEHVQLYQGTAAQQNISFNARM